VKNILQRKQWNPRAKKGQTAFSLIRGFQFFSCKLCGYTSNSSDYGYMYCIITC
jgi:hypothetical protein